MKTELTKKERIILESLQDSKHNINQLRITLGNCENWQTDLINFLKSEISLEHKEYQNWVNKAKKTIGIYNLDKPKYQKIKSLLPKPKRDTIEIQNYML